jgi:hypothetical protein
MRLPEQPQYDHTVIPAILTSPAAKALRGDPVDRLGRGFAAGVLTLPLVSLSMSFGPVRQTWTSRSTPAYCIGPRKSRLPSSTPFLRNSA